MIQRQAIEKYLLDLLAIPSPCGFTDEIVHYICQQLSALAVEYELTRRGTIRARLPGKNHHIARAVVTHIDSIGAMVRYIREDGRLSVVPIGFWSSRFAEGCRVTVFSQQKSFRGTLLPKVEWGVSRDHGVEAIPMDWDYIELRLDEPAYNREDVMALGLSVGDYIALDCNTEVLDNGYIIARNLDNKAGTAAVLETIRQLKTSNLTLEHDLFILFTVTETTGTGTGSALLPEVSELVTVDFASLTSLEKSPFKRVTLAAGDASGPYDYHLTAHLHRLLEKEAIPYQTKYLKAFHSDTAAALTAGYDVRTAVVAYAGDASHSVERVHADSLVNVARLLIAYAGSPPTFEKDESIVSVNDFSRQLTPENRPRPAQPVPDFDEIVDLKSADDADNRNSAGNNNRNKGPRS